MVSRTLPTRIGASSIELREGPQTPDTGEEETRISMETTGTAQEHASQLENSVCANSLSTESDSLLERNCTRGPCPSGRTEQSDECDSGIVLLKDEGTQTDIPGEVFAADVDVERVSLSIGEADISLTR